MSTSTFSIQPVNVTPISTAPAVSVPQYTYTPTAYAAPTTYSATQFTHNMYNPGTVTNSSFLPQLTLQPPPPPYLHRPASPELPAVDGPVASEYTQRLIEYELKSAGFDSVRKPALEILEQEVVTFIERLYLQAHAYANLSNRSGAIATDLLLACDDSNMNLQGLRAMKTKLRKRKRAGVEILDTPAMIPPRARSPSPRLLPSDDEDVPPTQKIPATLRTLPPYYPSLPPKHTYLQTPASPPKKAALPSLEKKLQTASLVQDSLKNLLVATEDKSGHEDAELLGHVVNWESNVYPRKRWKLSA